MENEGNKLIAEFNKYLKLFEERIKNGEVYYIINAELLTREEAYIQFIYIRNTQTK